MGPMRALFSALFALAAAAVGSCAPAAPASEPALWRITDADSEIWLYGTVHMLPPDLEWRGPRFEAAFARAEEFVTETDTGEAAVREINRLTQELGALPADESLSRQLEPNDVGRLQRVAHLLSLEASTLERQRPWLAALQLSYAATLRAGHRPEAGVEAVLMPEARARGLKLSYLETAAQQIEILASLPPADEARFLSQTLIDIEAGTDALTAMDTAWARGDVEELARVLEPQWRDVGPGIHEAIILERNRAWADEVARRLDGSGRIFIAVGAAHLVGDDSVVDLLRARGIAVEGP
ncbi:TraB/GumN family protein [Terricaulis sp.]|uniref:TraB/GumN family protein n=1 Tax=Terricaulis sp. TaxID=2768686 RepID=UPI002AC3B2A4|nr:TraB/GumN family protein [Terricaulis sp.]MDZ4691256.1 TraB/GumN family protein [Terricaulis sp.]